MNQFFILSFVCVLSGIAALSLDNDSRQAADYLRWIYLKISYLLLIFYSSPFGNIFFCLLNQIACFLSFRFPLVPVPSSRVRRAAGPNGSKVNLKLDPANDNVRETIELVLRL